MVRAFLPGRDRDPHSLRARKVQEGLSQAAAGGLCGRGGQAVCQLAVSAVASGNPTLLCSSHPKFTVACLVGKAASEQRVGGEHGTSSSAHGHKWCHTLSPGPGMREEPSLPPPGHWNHRSPGFPQASQRSLGERARGRRSWSPLKALLRTRAPGRQRCEA